MNYFARLITWCVPLLAAMTSLSCTDNSLTVDPDGRQVEAKGVIVGFEGLQPFSGASIENLTREVAGDLNLKHASSSGMYWMHVGLVRSAHAGGRPVYIVGYSMGAFEAAKLAQECRKADIPVDILFLLDPGAICAFGEKIPSNVRKVVVYQSSYCGDRTNPPTNGFIEDPDHTRFKFQDMSFTNHFSLPPALVGMIEREIGGS